MLSSTISSTPSVDTKTYVRLKINSKSSSIVDSSILLDFAGSGGGHALQRRSSFLPQELAHHDDESSLQQERAFSVGMTYCGAIFVTPMERSDPTVITRFVTGTKYFGDWNRLGMAGKGVYKYPHGAIYDGHFNRNGEFHGSGILTYPNGQRLEGFWKNGKLTSGASFVTSDDTMFNDDYCKMPDRRYQSEVSAELQPADQENITNKRPPVTIPDGCYDSGDGFYDPTLKVIRCYYNPNMMMPIDNADALVNEERKKIYASILHQTSSETEFITKMMRWMTSTKHAIESIPKSGREEWIKNNCRKAWTESTGFRPDLYEVWTTGARKYNTIIEQVIPDLDYTSSPRGTTISTMTDCSTPFDSQYSTLFSNIPGLDESLYSRDSRATRHSSLQKLSAMFIQPLGLTQYNIISFRQQTTKRLTMHRPSAYSSGSRFSRYKQGKRSTFIKQHSAGSRKGTSKRNTPQHKTNSKPASK